MVLSFIYGGVYFSQNPGEEPSLWVQANDNTHEFYSDSETAFVKMQILLEKSVKSKDGSAELILLKNYCIYYELKGDFKNLLLVAEHYKEKTEAYKSPYNEALSYIYIYMTHS
ncbi:hypothetical protein [Aequorivita capsosiphonis]|uniref:hypothetical protein n=1 Tax=Aequorivita capsosiphonis TaxID=487317 RepID=UPI00042664EA|nr:hypothetical protein [Aequorivita capsosiphonis]